MPEKHTNPPLKITVLGSGNSAGVPNICNYWGKCDPHEPRNNRTRPSLCVQSSNTTLVIDTGPDFRNQINRENINDVDAVLYTHTHGDHINGMDDLRMVKLRKQHDINIYGTQETIADLTTRFDHLFREKAKIYPKVVNPHIIEKDNLGQVMTVGDISFVPFEQSHGVTKTLGFRFGDLAYSTDMYDLNEKAFDVLSGVKIWIVDGNDYKLPEDLSYVHCTLQKIYNLNERIQAEEVYLTHLSPGIDYKSASQDLQKGYALAYDGLNFNI